MAKIAEIVTEDLLPESRQRGKTLIVKLALSTKVVDTVQQDQRNVIKKGDLPCTNTVPMS